MQMFLCILLLGFAQYCSSEETLGKVVFANVLYRHGERTPLEPYPTDPYKNESSWPVPFGQLTNIGKQQQINLGRWLRNRYSHLLSPKYSVHEIYVSSTDVDRTLMSAEANLAGMYAPSGSEVWDFREWTPVPVHTVPFIEDNLMGRKHCPRYSRELERVRASLEWKEIDERNAELYDYLSRMAGMNVTSVGEVGLLYNNLFIEELYNKTLPAWTKGVYPSKMKPEAVKMFELPAYNKILQRLKSGPLLKDMIHHMQLKSKNALTRNLQIYSAHDLTIGNMLMTFGLFEPHWPPFTATLLIELRIKAQNNYVVTMFYKNSTEEPTLLTLPGCVAACPLDQFVALTKDVIPDNWEQECLLEIEKIFFGSNVEKLSLLLLTNLQLLTNIAIFLMCIQIIRRIDSVAMQVAIARSESPSALNSKLSFTYQSEKITLVFKVTFGGEFFSLTYKITYTNKILFCLLLVKYCHSEDFPSVTSNYGKIRGHYKISHNGNEYEAYEGIPYALPPVGDRRFGPPEPTKSWKGELIANKFHDMCMGYNRDLVDGEYVRGVEDCLYMNIYTPVKKPNATLPVIFWIYAGGFQYGTIQGEEQRYLIDHDVIFITFNYRHGSLGFLSTEDEVVTGNMGLKDQAMALKWVSENIEFFGGDPKKITITGLSAGGASVHYHYLSPMSRGLFRSGISFSGTAFNSWAQAKDSRNKAIRLGQLVNCTANDINEMVDCLRTRPAYDIVSAQPHFMPWHLNEFSPFGPVVEKGSSKPFIDRSPIDIINNGDVYDAPWITGVVSEEGLYTVAELVKYEAAFQDLNENWDTIAPQLFQYYYTILKKDHASVAQKIRKHYFGDQPITRENFLNLTHLNGDRIFVVDAEKAARAQAQVNRSPVWFYYYSYRSTDSLSEWMSNTTENFGVSHSDDVFLVVANPANDPTKSENDLAMQRDLLQFWLSVVREGVPSFGYTYGTWDPIDPNNPDLRYLHMIAPKHFEEKSSNNLGEKLFWETIDFHENKPSRGAINRL